MHVNENFSSICVSVRMPQIARVSCEMCKTWKASGSVCRVILERMAVCDEIVWGQANLGHLCTCAVTAETLTCICVGARESVFLLLQHHLETMTTST